MPRDWDIVILLGGIACGQVIDVTLVDLAKEGKKQYKLSSSAQNRNPSLPLCASPSCSDGNAHCETWMASRSVGQCRQCRQCKSSSAGLYKGCKQCELPNAKRKGSLFACSGLPDQFGLFAELPSR